MELSHPSENLRMQTGGSPEKDQLMFHSQNLEIEMGSKSDPKIK